MNEFEVIRQYFSFSSASVSDADLGVGDDCALLSLAPGEQLAVTTDTLVSGVHFPGDGDPYLIARRALRVNLSDIAAMGATPLGFQLAISLPEIDSDWLEEFSRGLARDAAEFHCPLVGGDTTRGSLSITITLLGQVPHGKALLRSGASPGDLIYVTGTLGDSRAGLACLQGDGSRDFLLDRYWLPEPRLKAGTALRGYASAALDISDGLVQDLGHIARASGLDALIAVERLPLSRDILAFAGSETARQWALAGGDDYELCFTVPVEQAGDMEKTMAGLGVPVTWIGEMTAFSGTPVTCIDVRGNAVLMGDGGYDHFRS